MTTGFSAEAEEFAASVAGVVESGWGTAVAAPAGDLPTLAKTAVAQGWYELGGEGALDFLAAAVRELGARACPLPIVDAYVTARLVDGTTRARIASGEVRPLVAVASGPDATVFDHLDAAGDATHVLRLVPGAASAELLPIERTEAAQGLAVPAWSRVTATSEGAVTCGDGPDQVSGALSVYRLGLAVRALSAAARAHALAVEHAKVRRQFGRAIGAFGAVQQRTAACQIDVAAGERLVEDAVGHALAGGPDAGLAAELAIRFVRDAATSIMFGAQHTLGAIGYFEEHEAAWLFRRVHADVARLDAAGVPDVDRALVEDGRVLPASDLGPAAEEFRAEVRALLAAHRRDGAPDGAHDVEGLRAEMAERGLFALAWPRAEGGREASVEEQVVLNEEMKYARGPVDRAMSATLLLGHSILRHGTAEQKAEFLPLIREGRMAFCLGYSEPEAGSDLASLRTSAVRDGGHWVVNGQKSWTTRGQTASHVWLAVRTDPEAKPRHAGITIFLVPMDTPGIQIQEHVALSGEVSCTVFYDDVRIPDSTRVGEVNGGWKVITDALAAERVIMGGVAATLLRQLDDLLDVLRRDPAGILGPDGSRRRTRLASLAARLQAARVLVLAATRAMNDGAPDRLAAPMAAVLSGELAEDFGQGVLEILGPAAALGPDAPAAAGAGLFEHALRLAPMFVIGGGTNDVQRGIIARVLGLPRE